MRAARAESRALARGSTVSHTVCGQEPRYFTLLLVPDKSPPISAGASFLTGAAVHDSQCPQRGDASAGHADAASLQLDA